MKNYITLIPDNSGSMGHIANAAMADFNNTQESIKQTAISMNQDTIVNVFEFDNTWNSNLIKHAIKNASVTGLKPLTSYRTNTGTPLFDAVGKAIEHSKSQPDADDSNVSHLVMVVTDGMEEHSSTHWKYDLGSEIMALQSRGNWTFTFRVPRGYGDKLASRLGIPRSNILEWEATEQGMRDSSYATQVATTSYFSGRASGMRSSKRFYADLSNVTPTQVEATMKDISPEVILWPVSVKDDGVEIKTFVEKRNNRQYLKGAAFYQLSKPETIHDHKRIVIRDKTSYAVYEGAEARKMLGLPAFGHIRARPGNLGNFDLFIQSTSVNRKLKAGTQMVYWTGAVR